MAEQIKPRLQEPTSEAVDLDNLFAFLSDVQPNQGRNQIIDEIGEKMNELVEDLDIELETVIQQELEGLAQEQVSSIRTSEVTRLGWIFSTYLLEMLVHFNHPALSSALMVIWYIFLAFYPSCDFTFIFLILLGSVK